MRAATALTLSDGAHCREAVDFFNAGAQQHLPIKPHASHAASFKVGPKPRQGTRIIVNDGDVMSLPGHEDRQLFADPPAPHDDQSHVFLLIAYSALSQSPFLRSQRRQINLRTQSMLKTMGGKIRNIDQNCGGGGAI